MVKSKEDIEEDQWDLAFKEDKVTKEEVKEAKKEIKTEAKTDEGFKNFLKNKKGLTLFLYIKGQEFKRILQIPEFKEPVRIQLIQSIRGFRETIWEGQIEVNSSNENEAQINDDDFEAIMQQVIEDEKEYEAEVKQQKEIENEFEEALAIQDEKGRQEAAKRAEEEQKRLAEMKKKLEEERLRKRTTVSEKAKTK